MISPASASSPTSTRPAVESAAGGCGPSFGRRKASRPSASAGVMKRIYDQDRRRPGALDRVFLGYPLHRAVHDRLHLLVDVLERELVARLGRTGGVRILSAPCGTAEDLFRALERVAARGRVALSRVHTAPNATEP